MKKIFFIYWIWHFIILYVQSFIIVEDPAIAQMVGFLTVCNLSFLVIAVPVRDYITLKSTYSDNLYYKACLASLVTRMCVMCIAVLGLRQIHWILIGDGLTIALYFLIKYKLQNFSNSKMMSVYHEKEQKNYRL